MEKLSKLINVIVFITMLILLVPVIPVQASDPTWQYYFPVTVTESTGTSYADKVIPILTGLTPTNLINNGYIYDNATNTALGLSSDITTQNSKYMVSSEQIPIIVGTGTNNDGLPSNSSKTYNLYTGVSPVQSEFPVIVGHNGLATVTDNSTLEPADNYSISVSGYIENSTGESGNAIFKKDNAFVVKKSETVAGTVEANIYEMPIATYTTNLTVSANGYINDAAAAGDTPNYKCVDDIIGVPDDDTTYVEAHNWATTPDFYSITGYSSIPTNASITSVKIYFRNDCNGGYVVPALYLNGFETQGQTYSGSWGTRSEVLSRPNGGSWSLSDLSSLQIGWFGWVTNPSGVYARVTSLYAVVSWVYAPTTLSVSGITSGEHTVTLYANADCTYLSVDSDNISNTGIRDAYQNAGYYSSGGSYYSLKAAQIFTPDNDITISGANLYLSRYDTCSTTTYINIETIVGGIPSGTILATGSIATANISESDFDWHAFTLNTSVSLSSGTTYALVLYTSSDNVGSFSIVQWGTTPNIFLNGNACAYDPLSGSGSNWYTQLDTYFMFNLSPYFGTEQCVSIYNSASNWIFDYLNTMPYMTDISITKSGTQVAHYQPSSKITTTVVPDKVIPGSNNLVITWGTNPTGITITTGTPISYITYLSSIASDVANTVMPATMPNSWYHVQGETNSKITTLPFYGQTGTQGWGFAKVAEDTGIKVQTLYLMMMLATVSAVMFGVALFTGSTLLTLSIGVVTLGMAVSATVASGWMVFVLLIAGVSIWYLSRV